MRSRLDSGLDAPLSLVVAPAGAGKTVLLSQWIRSRPELHSAWIDITADDAAPAVVASRMVEAVSAFAPDVSRRRAYLLTGGARLSETFLENFAQSLAGVGKVVLIFDDLERISGSPVVTDLWRLVDLLPPNVHAVFASRVDLQLGWSRHRLGHGLVEIRQRELAFDDETTGAVLHRITGRPVSPETLTTVTERTEGWAVGVQLTALGFRFSEDPARVVDALLYSDQLVVEYMSEEVLEALDADRRDALMRIAVLDKFSPDLVRELTGMEGEQFIAGLERDSLFVVSVAGRPGWHRLHPLFRDLLRRRLHALDPHEETELLASAAAWLLQRGEVEEGLECLCRAGRWDVVLARALAEGERALDAAQAAVVRGWLERVPADLRATSPRAELLLAVTEEMTGRKTDAVESLRDLLMNDRLSCGERQIALSHLAAGVQFLPHPETSVDAARRGLRLLDQEPDARRPSLLGMTSRPMLTLMCELSLGRGLLYLGDLVSARSPLEIAIRHSEFAHTRHFLDALGCLALVNSFSGRLVEATEQVEKSLALAKEFRLLDDPSLSDAFAARALAGVLSGDLAAAALSLEQAVVRAAADERTPLMWIAHLVAILIDSDNTQPVISAEPPGPPPPLVRRAMMALEMRRARFAGAPLPPPGTESRWSPLAFEELAGLLTGHRTDTARARLARLRIDESPPSPVAVVERDIVVAWMWALDGRRQSARERLGSALTIAQAEGLVHPFVRAGEHVVGLVDDMFGAHSEFARRVVHVARGATTRSQTALLQELTARELELLAYLPSRLTIGDIAERCYVSTNTVKTHLGHIYRKLSVPGRNAAVERAIELHLLQRRDAEPVSL
ncbi:LuxR C-terminal-related transcriptional regulator [Microbacterium yannicii]|uniref:LuxR C-terminal-related transcriptional regulator n=1 Tax=Microbacterium yannicii TaxID=671622 RepID=UPI001ED9A08E|nr:LuxR C-terminal-related transcriptional regulator [Microbacterium yannicii]